MTKHNVIIIHGAYGHPAENWFGWLKRELETRHVECHVPPLPTPDNQSLQSWLQVFAATCGKYIHANSILVGHSLGAAFLLRWLEQSHQKIHTSILAGAFIGEVGISKFDTINQSFFTTPFNWQRIQKQCEQFYCFHGSNDPYVPRKNFDFIASQLAARKIMIANGGHLNAAAGYTTFPHVLELILQLLSLSKKLIF